MPEWRKLMEEARSIQDQARRKTDFDAAHKILLDNMPWIPVIQPMDTYGVRRYIDWKPRGDQALFLQEVKLRR